MWQEVQVKVQRTELKGKHDVPHCITYCKDWSGGLHCPSTLREVDAYAKPLDECASIWRVQPTNNPDKANLMFLSYTCTAPGQGGTKATNVFPIMSNKQPLKPGDVLYLFHKSGAITPKCPR